MLNTDIPCDPAIPLLHVSIQGKWKRRSTRTKITHECSWEHYSSELQSGNNLKVPQLMNGQRKYGTSIQRNIIWQLKKNGVLVQATIQMTQIYAKWKMSITKDYVSYTSLPEMSRISTSIETEDRLGAAWSLGEAAEVWRGVTGFFEGWWKCSKIGCANVCTVPSLF